MSKSQNKKDIPPPPKGKKELTDDSSEEPIYALNNTKPKVPVPDWENFPEIEIKNFDIERDALERSQSPEFKLSTLFENLPDKYK